MGTLYVVATPIGNLEDITIRVIKTLFSVHAIASEDTRKTGQLLKILRERYVQLFADVNNYSSSEVPLSGTESRSSEGDSSRQARTIKTIPDQRLISYYEQNEFRRIPEIVNALKNGLNIALVSDAGTPAISDPGFKLIRECIKEGIRVESVPGPSSVISALVSSGLPTDKFLFLGYPPHKSGHRTKLFQNIKAIQQFNNSTIILFEAPHKLLTTLTEMKTVFGDIQIVICRELTKIHEEIRREKISDSIFHFQNSSPKGEIVLLFHF